MGIIVGRKPIVENGLVFCVDVLSKDSYIGSGTTINDIVGSFDGTSVPSGTLTNSSISTSPTPHMLFDGSGYLQLSGHRPTTLHTNSNTLEIWFQNNTGGGYEGIFSEGVPYQVYAVNNKIEAYLRKPGESGGSYFISGATTNTIGSDTAWTLVSLVRDVTEFKYFINGVLDKTITGITATDVVESSTGRQDTLIGTYATGQFRYTGGVGPVRQYNRALSADDILKNFNAQKERFGL
jgi:hypothetical protein|tara:strand:+ start:301 stop:1011 length:711 start_codon:yes stop_codon:yes gene_type:complete